MYFKDVDRDVHRRRKTWPRWEIEEEENLQHADNLFEISVLK